MRTALLVSFVALLGACGSFDAAESETNGAPDGSSSVATEGGAPSEAGAASDAGTRFCPQPAAPNTQCWDFDVGGLPGGATQSGEFAFDTVSFVSPSRALTASTHLLPQGGGEAWARLEHVLGSAPKTIRLEQKIRGLGQPYVQVGEIAVNGNNAYYAVNLVTDEGNLQSIENTFFENSSTAHLTHPLGSLSNDEWHQLSIEIELIDFPGNNAKRRLRLEVDGQLKFESTDGMNLLIVTPTQTVARAGITYVGGFAGEQPPRTVTIDDVLVSWTP